MTQSEGGGSDDTVSQMVGVVMTRSEGSDDTVTW